MTWVLLVALLLAGCASAAPPVNGHPRLAALPSVMERVREDPAYQHFCIWGGRCKKAVPAITITSLPRNGETQVVARYLAYRNALEISHEALSAPDWQLQVIVAHELGHWVRGDLVAEGLLQDSACARNPLACEIGANREAVRILEVGWGIPRVVAIEHVHRHIRFHVATSKTHNRAAELAALRETFACSDTTERTCANGPGTSDPTGSGGE